MLNLEWQFGKCYIRRWKMCHKYLNVIWISGRCLPKQKLLKRNHFVWNYEKCLEILCKQNSEYWQIFRFEEKAWSNRNRVLQKNTYITEKKKCNQEGHLWIKKIRNKQLKSICHIMKKEAVNFLSLTAYILFKKKRTHRVNYIMSPCKRMPEYGLESIVNRKQCLEQQMIGSRVDSQWPTSGREMTHKRIGTNIYSNSQDE